MSGQLQEQNGGDGVRDRPPTENLQCPHRLAMNLYLKKIVSYIVQSQDLSWVSGRWWSLSWRTTVRRKDSTPRCRWVECCWLDDHQEYDLFRRLWGWDLRTVKELRVHRRAGGSWALSSPPPPSTSWSRCLALARRRTRRSSTSCPAACPMGLSSKLMGDLVAQSKPSPMLNELGALRLAAVNPAEDLA